MLLGWDHLLFITGVVLLAGGLGRAAKLISLFVAGHSLTLLTRVSRIPTTLRACYPLEGLLYLAPLVRVQRALLKRRDPELTESELAHALHRPRDGVHVASSHTASGENAMQGRGRRTGRLVRFALGALAPAALGVEPPAADARDCDQVAAGGVLEAS